MNNCIFCRIVKKEIPASIVYEDDQVFAFNDIAPQAPTHILIIPKKHVASVSDLADFIIISDIYRLIWEIAVQKGIDKTGFRVVLNHGERAGQSVPHLHFHLLGGRELHWPPG